MVLVVTDSKFTSCLVRLGPVLLNILGMHSIYYTHTANLSALNMFCPLKTFWSARKQADSFLADTALFELMQESVWKVLAHGRI